MSMNGQEMAPQPAKTVTLPATRAALTWDRATDALVAAAEVDEAKARAKYEAAKDDYQAARQQAHLIRQLRQIARVDGAPEKPSTISSIGRPLNGRWSRAHDACVDCGLSDSKHASGGRCQRCDSTARRAASRETPS